MSKNDPKKLEELKLFISTLPEKPGSYQYYDSSGTIIYVGKAKNLKRRVQSYFNKEQEHPKTRKLVSQIDKITFSVVNTEEDALLLENNLIKKYKPKYNVLLKDDKTYASICITHEDYPRILKIRTSSGIKGDYFGPYIHSYAINALLDLLQKAYLPRPCNFNLSRQKVDSGDYKLCLNYQIGKCKGPCVGRQSRAAYLDNIEECKEILKGNIRGLIEHIKEQIQFACAELNFEKAQELKEKIILLQTFQTKSEVVNCSFNNLDVFNIDTNENTAYVNYLHIAHGNITQAFTIEMKKSMDETPEDLLGLAVVELRQRFRSRSREIILPFHIDLALENTIITVPQRGEKHRLLKLSELNVREYKIERIKQSDKLNPEQKSTRLMKEIQDHLHLKKLPYRIELFDNSNIQGDNAVAACVVFEKLKPNKKEYRKYNIKTVVGPNDYASMQEVIERRYKRLLEEGKRMPDLIITDGGKGQMECARSIIEDRLHLDIPIAGLAKDKKHRTNELLFGNPPVTIGLKQTDELFRVLTQMQNEVHRFAITFHREKRAKQQTHSLLDEIKGVGEKTKTLLLRHFKSFKRISEASEAEICELLGPKKGTNIYQQLHP